MSNVLTFTRHHYVLVWICLCAFSQTLLFNEKTKQIPQRCEMAQSVKYLPHKWWSEFRFSETTRPSMVAFTVLWNLRDSVAHWPAWRRSRQWETLSNSRFVLAGLWSTRQELELSGKRTSNEKCLRQIACWRLWFVTDGGASSSSLWEASLGRWSWMV